MDYICLGINDFVGSVIIDKMQLTFIITMPLCNIIKEIYHSISSIVLFSYPCLLPYSLTMPVELKFQFSPLWLDLKQICDLLVKTSIADFSDLVSIAVFDVFHF